MSRGGTIRPNPGFDANTVAENLKRAMKGFGTDEKTIIKELTKISNSQRQMVREAYTGMYGDDLIDALKSELGGHFEDVIIALMEETSKYDAKQLHDAMRGFGTKESLLIEIVCSRTDDELAAIRDVYEEMYGESLKDAIEGDTTGDFENLLVSLVVGERAGEQYVDPTKAKEVI
ncbi:hypothetical protein AB6A40_010788 [Gnathostoma spinigerum]|uniref:Annexin n=1 Tax=Gnathostoma spinigerum TaxID=75299 RepID=A0ABD6F287_9BILA